MLAQNLKALRRQRGITQAELSEMLGLTQQAVARWEVDKSEPDAKTLNRLADYYGVSVDYLLGREKTPSPSEESTLLEKYRKLTVINKQTLNSLLNTFLLAQQAV